MSPFKSIESPKCYECSKSVYFAEQVSCLGKIYHKNGCLKCFNCFKVLREVNNVLDHDQEPYCKSCHQNLFGPKGYNNSSNSGITGDYSPSPNNSPVRLSSATVISSGPSPNKFLGSPTFGSPNNNVINSNRFGSPSTSTSTSTSNTSNSNIYPYTAPLSYTNSPLKTSSYFPSSTSNTFLPTSPRSFLPTSPKPFSSSPSNSNYNNNNIKSNNCPTCSKPVYHAEQILALSGNFKFHKSCLKCGSGASTITTFGSKIEGERGDENDGCGKSLVGIVGGINERGGRG